MHVIRQQSLPKWRKRRPGIEISTGVFSANLAIEIDEDVVVVVVVGSKL